MGNAIVIICLVLVIAAWFWYQTSPKTASWREASAKQSQEARARQSAQRQSVADGRAKIVCQFCQQPGGVTTSVQRVKGRPTATRMGMGMMTLGATTLVTGTNKSKGTVTVMSCSNCGMQWDAATHVPKKF